MLYLIICSAYSMRVIVVVNYYWIGEHGVGKVQGLSEHQYLTYISFLPTQELLLVCGVK